MSTPFPPEKRVQRQARFRGLTPGFTSDCELRPGRSHGGRVRRPAQNARADTPGGTI
jgi:hypothetical protein